MADRRLRVIIVGAGLGGLAAAQALRDFCEVILLEQSKSLGEVGAGINLSPNAVRVLDSLGFSAPVRKAGFRPRYHVFRDWKSGRSLFRADVESEYEALYGAPHLSIHRADLHNILQVGLPSSCLMLNSRCVGVKQNTDGAVVELENNRTIEADFVIGADGIKSSVRECLFGKDTPRFTGNTAWRFTIPASSISEGEIESAVTNWLGPGGHVVHYFVRTGELVNFVAVREAQSWAEESWTAQGDKQELLASYEGWNKRLLSLLDRAGDCFKWGLFDRDPLPKWTEGRVTLLGDAAHPMLPFLGQGAAMAFEDALALAKIMQDSRCPVRNKLVAYEKIRLPRASRVQRGAWGRARENHLRSPLARGWRNLKFKWRQLNDPHATLHNAKWIYEYDAGKSVDEHFSTAPPM